MRRGHYMSLSFLDILIGFLGSILFMFIIVDKGSLPIHDIGEQDKALTKIYGYFDESGRLIHNLRYPSDTVLNLSEPYLLILDSNQETPEVSCPPCPELNCSACPVNAGECPNPAHHKQELCPNPKVHEQKKRAAKPIACNKVHCNDKDCERKEKIVKQLRTIVDPISFPYQLGFAVKDMKSISRDVDLRVQPSTERANMYVSSSNKNLGSFRWIDLNRTPFWQNNLVTGGEFIISQQLAPGTYVIEARYDDKRNSEPDFTEVQVIVCTKKRGELKSKIEKRSLPKSREWTKVMKVRISQSGQITLI